MPVLIMLVNFNEGFLFTALPGGWGSDLHTCCGSGTNGRVHCGTKFAADEPDAHGVEWFGFTNPRGQFRKRRFASQDH